MASASQKKALEVLTERVKSVEERYDGYRDSLAELLRNVMTLESDPPHKVQQEFSAQVSTFSKRLIQRGGNLG